MEQTMDSRLPQPAALRHQAETEDHLWATCASLLLSPSLVWAAWVFAIAWTTDADPRADLRYAALFVIAVCAAPVFFVSLMVRNGRISDLNLRESRERYIPYSIAIIGGLCCLIVYPQFDANPILYVVTLVSIVKLALMLVGTLFVHISFHAAGMASIVSATTLLFGFDQGLLFLPVLLLVSLARLVLSRHTPAQILIGALIGVLTPLAVIAAMGIFL
jgi:hypothetical protein